MLRKLENISSSTLGLVVSSMCCTCSTALCLVHAQLTVPANVYLSNERRAACLVMRWRVPHSSLLNTEWDMMPINHGVSIICLQSPLTSTIWHHHLRTQARPCQCFEAQRCRAEACSTHHHSRCHGAGAHPAPQTGTYRVDGGWSWKRSMWAINLKKWFTNFVAQIAFQSISTQASTFRRHIWHVICSLSCLHWYQS